jgi:hypothetical protein
VKTTKQKEERRKKLKIKFLQEKAVEATKEKEDKSLSSKNIKACHNVNTFLLQSVAEIGIRSTMKSS